MNPEYLVGDVEGGDWLPPPTQGKEKAQKERLWDITLLEDEGDNCGTYLIAPVPGLPPYEEEILSDVLTNKGVDVNLGAVYVFIEHVHTRVPHIEARDYWLIGIVWRADTLLGLVVRTDIGDEWEGEYDQLTDTWTVTFNNAECGLIENDGSGAISEFWMGQLSFTLEITRTPNYS